MKLLTNTAFLTATFGIVWGYTAFIMVLLWSALFNGWVVTLDFNHYGEGLIEFVLFGLIAPVLVTTFIISYANELRKKRCWAMSDTDELIISYAKQLRKRGGE